MYYCKLAYIPGNHKWSVSVYTHRELIWLEWDTKPNARMIRKRVKKVLRQKRMSGNLWSMDDSAFMKSFAKKYKYPN